MNLGDIHAVAQGHGGRGVADQVGIYPALDTSFLAKLADDFLNARFAHASMGDTLFHKKCRAVVGAAFELLFEGKHSMGRKVRLAVFAAFAKQHDLSLFKADIGQI